MILSASTCIFPTHVHRRCGAQPPPAAFCSAGVKRRQNRVRFHTDSVLQPSQERDRDSLQSSLRPSIALDSCCFFPDQVHAFSTEPVVVSAGQVAVAVIEMVVAGARPARTGAMRQLAALANICQAFCRAENFWKELLHKRRQMFSIQVRGLTPRTRDLRRRDLWSAAALGCVF